MLINILFIAVTLLTVISVVRLLNITNLMDQVRGKQPYEITEGENNWNALMSLFMIVFGWFIYFYFYVVYIQGGLVLPHAASVHGLEIDKLERVSFIIISIAYLIVQPVLWYFMFKYRFRKDRKAFHYAHNNKLELIWTIVPAIIFCGLIFYGLVIWNDTLEVEYGDEKVTVELYARQFDWTARYAGDDKMLGEANYCMISDNNSLGLITAETIDSQLVKLQGKKQELEKELASFPNPEKSEELDKAYSRLNHQIKMVSDLKRKNEKTPFLKSYDDVVVNPGGEIHIPVGRPIELKMRSQDVIHSAYLPHFRVHMYCVPGMTTTFPFIPNITSDEMKSKLNNKQFDFLLYCNNICGSAHFNMQMKIVVETEEQYNKWMKEQQTFRQVIAPKPVEAAPVDGADTSKKEVAKL